MAKVEYSKEFLQISSQLKLSEEEKKKGWTGAVDSAGEQKQVLVFEKAGKFFALTNAGAKPLEGVKDIDSAKTLAKQNITGKPDFGGLNFSDEALAAMSKTREGGGGAEISPTGADVKPAVAGSSAPSSDMLPILTKDGKQFGVKLATDPKTGKKTVSGTDEKMPPLDISAAKTPEEAIAMIKAASEASPPTITLGEIPAAANKPAIVPILTKDGKQFGARIVEPQAGKKLAVGTDEKMNPLDISAAKTPEEAIAMIKAASEANPPTIVLGEIPAEIPPTGDKPTTPPAGAPPSTPKPAGAGNIPSTGAPIGYNSGEVEGGVNANTEQSM